MDEPPPPTEPRRRTRSGRESMRTEELPLPDDVATAAGPERPARKSRRSSSPAPASEPDLFDFAPAAAPSPAFRPAGQQEQAAASGAAAPAPAPAPAPEPTAPTAEAPSILDPEILLLQPADPQRLRPSDRPDGYLYWICDRSEADRALAHGVAVDPSDPVMLCERPGVMFRLSILAEEGDGSAGDLAVLRMSRIAVEAMIEPDPERSREAGSGCWTLGSVRR